MCEIIVWFARPNIFESLLQCSGSSSAQFQQLIPLSISKALAQNISNPFDSLFHRPIARRSGWLETVMPWAIGTLGKAALNFPRRRRTCFAASIDLTSPFFFFFLSILSLWSPATGLSTLEVGPNWALQEHRVQICVLDAPQHPSHIFRFRCRFKCFRQIDKSKPSQNLWTHQRLISLFCIFYSCCQD